MQGANRTMLEEAAREYDIPNDFEQVNIELASRLIIPFCQGRDVLEIGCASCEMSRMLLPHSRSLTIVEPAPSFAEGARRRFGNAVTVHGSYLHEITEARSFDVIIMASLLHHVEDPLSFLATVRPFCSEKTRVLATVPHVKSLHRRLGVAAGMIRELHDDTPRNIRYRQFGKFDVEILSGLFAEAGFRVEECCGYMLKPFSSEQMMSLALEPRMIDALFQAGREFPELSSQLFLHATLAPGHEEASR